MAPKVSEIISVKDAMDNISSIASINMESPPPIGIVGETKIVTNEEETELDEIRWLSAEGSDVLLSVLDNTYRSVYQYLRTLHEKNGVNLEASIEKEGISAMMSLVGESAQKMDAYLAFRFDLKLPKIAGRESFQILQQFYHEKFSGGKEAWESTWAKEKSPLKANGSELRDFESLLKDREYELFYIADEEGKPYLSDRLLRNIKLTADFDVDGASFEEDPFFQVKAMHDRDLQATAGQILGQCSEEISLFYSVTKKTFGFSCARNLSQALIALFLAANSRHLLQRTTGKTCSQYFHDFQKFLREALSSPEYQKWMTYPPEEARERLLVALAHKLCFSLVVRSCGVKQEAIGLIHRTARRGGELLPKDLNGGKGSWNQLLFDDEKMRTLLDKFPGGPLLKTLDVIRSEQEEGVLIPFDPWIQENLPCSLYSLKKKRQASINVISFGAPTCQAKISRAEIIDEFRGFLRYLAANQKRHLLINLQDRLSWQESARSRSLERLQENSAFSSSLLVITLPKNTDFYHQKGSYKDLDDADEFISNFKEQLQNPQESGFFFPPKWNQKELLKFTDKTLDQIHNTVFEGMEMLNRQMREDFIEIFYQLLILETIDRFNVDSMSFTCKDAVDTGSYASGLFYGFLKGYEGDLETKENLDFLRFLFYWKALSVRERAPGAERFFRVLSALETWHRCMEREGRGAVKAFPITWVA